MRLFLAILLVVLIPDYAFAGPLIAAPLIGVLGIAQGSFAATAVTAFVNIGVSAGLSAVSGAFAKKGKRQPQKAQQVKGVVEIGNSPRMYVYGRARIGNVIIFGNTNKPPNSRRVKYRLIYLCSHEIDKIEEYFINKAPAIVDTDGVIASPPWLRPTSTPNVFSKWGYVQFKQASNSTTAWPQLLDNFETWTADHQFNGATQFLAYYPLPRASEELFLKLDASNTPLIETVIRGKKCYDPRTQAYVWTQNAALIIADVLSLIPSIGFDAIDWPTIAQQADKADELVEAKSGLEPRAQLSGVVLGDKSSEEILADMLRSAGARLLNNLGESQTLYGIDLLDDSYDVEYSFQSSDVLEVTEVLGREALQRPNAARITYYSPEKNYEEAELDVSNIAWVQDDAEVNTYGLKTEDINLPYCFTANQASRIARRVWAEDRQSAVTLKTNMLGFIAWLKNARVIEAPLIEGDAPTKLIVDSMKVDFSNEPGIEFSCRRVPDLTTFSPALDEATPPPVVGNQEFDTDLPKPNPPSAIIAVQYGNGSYELRIVGDDVPRFLSIQYATYDQDGLLEAWNTADGYAGKMGFKAGNFIGQTITARQQTYTIGDDEEISHLSDYYTVDNVQIDNTKPSPPVLTGSKSLISGQEAQDYQVVVDYQSNDANVVQIVLKQGTQTLGTQTKPFTQYKYVAQRFDQPLPTVYTAIAYASDGTASDPATLDLGEW